jgi:hypothetical protein
MIDGRATTGPDADLPFATVAGAATGTTGVVMDEMGNTDPALALRA